MACRIALDSALTGNCCRLFFVAALAGAVTLTACTPGGISRQRAAEISERAATRPLLISFEGLQPFSGTRAHKVTREVAETLDMAHSATSGNPAAHRRIIREAHRNRQPIYIVGYSMGCTSAFNLSRWCQSEGIEVRVLFLLDPAVLPGRIPDNVGHVVVVESTSTHLSAAVDYDRLQDRTRTRLDQLTIPGSGHGSLPAESLSIIRSRISSDMRISGTPY